MPSTLVTTLVTTPVGELLVTADDAGVTEIRFGGGPADDRPGHQARHPHLATAAEQLDEYFHGARTAFDMPLSLAGGLFERRVWEELRRIPYGETRTYGEIAASLGQPRAARAVGLANNHNPVPIVVPCHRVIGAGGKLVGYGGGLERKRFLLSLEARVQIEAGW